MVRSNGDPESRGVPIELRQFIVLATIALIVGLLYWAQSVLIPFALACLLTFLLSPVVGALDRFGLGRVPAVMIVAIVTLCLAIIAGWLIAREISALASELPKYNSTIRHRIADIRVFTQTGSLRRMNEIVNQVLGEIQQAAPAETGPDKAVPVVLRQPSWIPSSLPNLFSVLAAGGVVAVLVIFMLLERRLLRDRLIRLVGYQWVTVTTKALDEVAARISRYLLMQSLTNGAFGVAACVGLMLIGLPYAALWGSVAGVLRFIPYVGVWVGASLPIALSLAVFPGWGQPALVAAVFVVLEVAANVGVEPWLYGHSAGLSPVALLVAVIFWTWLWGPIGFLLATPLTVCVMVVGRHLPAAGFLLVLMGNEPGLDARAQYYQRLLARDQDEAAEVVERYVESSDPDTVYDEILVAALGYARQDRARGRITDADAEFVLQGTQKIAEDLAEERARAEVDAKVADAARPIRVVLCPARDDFDAVALGIVRGLLDSGRYDVQMLATAMLTSEVVQRVESADAAVCCIGAVAPGGVNRTRHLCKRLRARCPDVALIVGRWGPLDEREEDGAHVTAIEADRVATSLAELPRHVAELGSTHLRTGSGRHELGERESTAALSRENPAPAGRTAQFEAGDFTA